MSSSGCAEETGLAEPKKNSGDLLQSIFAAVISKYYGTSLSNKTLPKLSIVGKKMSSSGWTEETEPTKEQLGFVQINFCRKVI